MVNSMNRKDETQLREENVENKKIDIEERKQKSVVGTLKTEEIISIKQKKMVDGKLNEKEEWTQL